MVPRPDRGPTRRAPAADPGRASLGRGRGGRGVTTEVFPPQRNQGRTEDPTTDRESREAASISWTRAARTWSVLPDRRASGRRSNGGYTVVVCDLIDLGGPDAVSEWRRTPRAVTARAYGIFYHGGNGGAQRGRRQPRHVPGVARAFGRSFGRSFGSVRVISTASLMCCRRDPFCFCMPLVVTCDSRGEVARSAPQPTATAATSSYDASRRRRAARSTSKAATMITVDGTWRPGRRRVPSSAFRREGSPLCAPPFPPW